MSKVFIVGIGPGHSDYILPKAVKILQKCDVIIGAKRNLNSVNPLNLHQDKKMIAMDKKFAEITRYIIDNYSNEKIAVVVSGDTGFYSLLSYLKKKLPKEIPLEVVPGISSIQYLYAKLKRSWQNAYISSLHGREIDILDEVKKHREVVLLTDYHWNPTRIAQYLVQHSHCCESIRNKWMYIACNLSYENEEILKFKITEVPHRDFGINVVVICDE